MSFVNGGALLSAAAAELELPVEPVATCWAVPVEMLVEPLAPAPVAVVLVIVPGEPSAELGAPAEPVEVLLVFAEGAVVPAVSDGLVVAGLDEPVALVVDPDEPVVPAADDDRVIRLRCHGVEGGDSFRSLSCLRTRGR